MSARVYRLRDNITKLWVIFKDGRPYGTQIATSAQIWDSFEGADAVRDALGKEHGTETTVVEEGR